MAEVVVLAEVFAVVAGDDDPRVREAAGRAQVAEEATELSVQAIKAFVVKITEPAADILQLSLALVALVRRRGGASS